jgi:hypothetical protein
VVAACGGGRPSDDVTPVAPVASADDATSLQQEFVRVVQAVSPSVVQIRTPHPPRRHAGLGRQPPGKGRRPGRRQRPGGDPHRGRATPPGDLRGLVAGRGRRHRARPRQPARAALERHRGHGLGRGAQRSRGRRRHPLVGHPDSAPINPGNSGGALVDRSGRVIGIPTLAALDPQMGSSVAPGIGFAIAGNTVRRAAAALARSR